MVPNDNDGTTIVEEDDDDAPSVTSSADNDKPASNINAAGPNAQSAHPSVASNAHISNCEITKNAEFEDDSVEESDLDEAIFDAIFHASVEGTAASSEQKIGGRYKLVHRLGHGSQGEVWLAYDPVTEGHVAFKWMHADIDTARTRVWQEIAVLRRLHVPGVVQFIDEGIALGKPFIVMEYFPGRHFPGVEGIAEWSAIANTTLVLLETLSQVHANGIVHRDLKPENVCVSSDGRPGLMDFGVSYVRDPRESPTALQGIAGTPLFFAPEQTLGRQVDARTDLFAVGLMLYRALSGRLPHVSPEGTLNLHLRQNVRAQPLRALAPHVPTNVAAVIDRLLAVRPEERFASADDVIEALRITSIPLQSIANRVRAVLPAEGFASENDLVKLFDGPNRILHLGEDAARILWQRTEGDPERIVAELERWIRLGLAQPKGALFAVNRAALDWLAVGPFGTLEERRIRDLFTAGKIPEGSRETVAWARRQTQDGRLAAATRVLVDGLRIVREHHAVAEEIAILTMLAKVALVEGTSSALERVSYELARPHAPRASLLRLRVLMKASSVAPGPQGIQALEVADKLGPLRDLELERARHRIRIRAASVQASATLVAKVLGDVRAWWRRSGHPLPELTLLEGEARQRYTDGDFAGTADIYLRAAQLEPWTTARINTMLSSASASLEAFRFQDAWKTAEFAREQARLGRHAYCEGRAEWVIRSVQYRTGKTTGPDMELVRVIDHLGADPLEALVCLNEAAAAMRADEYGLVRGLAARATTLWNRLKRPLASMLPRSLAIACGAQTDETEVRKLAELAKSCTVPGIGIQVLGLLGRVYPERRSSWQNAVDRLVSNVPREHWQERMDVLSVEEALAGAR